MLHRSCVAMLVVCLVACGAGQKMASAPMAAAAPSMAASPPPLDRSLFARDPAGQLSEDALQKILAAPIELDLPARVGVHADQHRDRLARARAPTRSRARGPGSAGRPPAPDAAFSLVTRDDGDPVGRARHGGAARGRRAVSPALPDPLSRGDREALRPEPVGVGLRDRSSARCSCRASATRSTATSRRRCSTSRRAC